MKTHTALIIGIVTSLFVIGATYSHAAVISASKVTIQSTHEGKIQKTKRSKSTQKKSVTKLTIKSPNGGESLKLGTSATIKFNYSGPTPAKIRLHLYKGSKKLGKIGEVSTTAWEQIISTGQWANIRVARRVLGIITKLGQRW